jgi:hypothetical protein
LEFFRFGICAVILFTLDLEGIRVPRFILSDILLFTFVFFAHFSSIVLCFPEDFLIRFNMSFHPESVLAKAFVVPDTRAGGRKFLFTFTTWHLGQGSESGLFRSST